MKEPPRDHSLAAFNQGIPRHVELVIMKRLQRLIGCLVEMPAGARVRRRGADPPGRGHGRRQRPAPSTRRGIRGLEGEGV